MYHSMESKGASSTGKQQLNTTHSDSTAYIQPGQYYTDIASLAIADGHQTCQQTNITAPPNIKTPGPGKFAGSGPQLKVN